MALGIDDDPEWDAVQSRDDAAIEFWGARIDGNCMALTRVANLLRPSLEHPLQRHAGVVGRAADDEVVGDLAPCLAQPFQVRLEAP